MTFTTSLKEGTTINRLRFHPVRQEWSRRTGHDTWLVWKHGDDPKDEERLPEALAVELAREEAEDR